MPPARLDDPHIPSGRKSCEIVGGVLVGACCTVSVKLDDHCVGAVIDRNLDVRASCLAGRGRDGHGAILVRTAQTIFPFGTSVVAWIPPTASGSPPEFRVKDRERQRRGGLAHGNRLRGNRGNRRRRVCRRSHHGQSKCAACDICSVAHLHCDLSPNRSCPRPVSPSPCDSLRCRQTQYSRSAPASWTRKLPKP